METNQPVVNTTSASQTEKLTIKHISIVDSKEEGRLFIVHTTPSKSNPPKQGEKESRFKIREKVFANFAKANDSEVSLFRKDAVGGVYTLTTKAVKAGDAFLNGGNGTYQKDHNAVVSQSIELCAEIVAEDRAAQRSAYYAAKYAKGASVSAPAMPIINKQDGSNIEM